MTTEYVFRSLEDEKLIDFAGNSTDERFIRDIQERRMVAANTQTLLDAERSRLGLSTTEFARRCGTKEDLVSHFYANEAVACTAEVFFYTVNRAVPNPDDPTTSLMSAPLILLFHDCAIDGASVAPNLLSMLEEWAVDIQEIMVQLRVRAN